VTALAVALLYPDLLGTYGDSGNAAILATRARWRGLPAEVVTVRSGQAVPAGCQIYVVGGGEDLPQYRAARQLGAGSDGGPLVRAVEGGAVVLAVCAGLQILGRAFPGPEGHPVDGVGLLDAVTRPGRGQRMVGEAAVEPEPDLGLPTLSGYENHAGVTEIGPGSRPLGRVLAGAGNGGGSGLDGARSERVVATYLHGPVLARNPALADLLLGWVAGPLPPLDDAEAEGLRRERLEALGAAGRGRGWRSAVVPPGRGRRAGR
jgi:CobQ-like glutamine amidotransferase family enzyme